MVQLDVGVADAGALSRQPHGPKICSQSKKSGAKIDHVVVDLCPEGPVAEPREATDRDFFAVHAAGGERPGGPCCERASWRLRSDAGPPNGTAALARKAPAELHGEPVTVGECCSIAVVHRSKRILRGAAIDAVS